MTNKLNVGGQAVIEGVMMRSANFYSVAVRTPAKKIKIISAPVNSLAKKYGFLKLPILRGFLALIESMSIGFKALDFSTKIYEENEVKKNTKKIKKSIISPEQKEKIVSFLMYLLSFIIVFFVFVYLPILLTKFMSKKFLFLNNNFLFNITIVIQRLIIFFIYIWAISFMEDIKRLFMYHGAEHKAIYTYENGKKLTPENAEKFTTLHPRCGTAFIFITFVISIIFFAILLPPKLNIINRLIIEIPLIIPIAGISYEILKLSDKIGNNIFFKLFIFPGLLFQKITTMNPDREQLKVALAALKNVLQKEKNFLKKEKSKNAGKIGKNKK